MEKSALNRVGSAAHFCFQCWSNVQKGVQEIGIEAAKPNCFRECSIPPFGAAARDEDCPDRLAPVGGSPGADDRYSRVVAGRFGIGFASLRLRLSGFFFSEN